MKIAVSYSGALRTLPITWEVNHEVFQEHGWDVDYYISTWEKPGYTKVDRFNDPFATGETNIVYADLPKPDEILTPDHIKVPYKRLEIESTDVMDTLLRRGGNYSWSIMHPGRLFCQYYKMWRGFIIIQEKEQYDLVLRLRSDVTITKLPTEIDFEKIYVNNLTYVDAPIFEGRMMNEMIYLSNLKNMERIVSIYENFPDIWDRNIGAGEFMTFNHFERENLLPLCEPFDFGLKVIRANGKIEICH